MVSPRVNSYRTFRGRVTPVRFKAPEDCEVILAAHSEEEEEEDRQPSDDEESPPVKASSPPRAQSPVRRPRRDSPAPRSYPRKPAPPKQAYSASRTVKITFDDLGPGGVDMGSHKFHHEKMMMTCLRLKRQDKMLIRADSFSGRGFKLVGHICDGTQRHRFRLESERDQDQIIIHPDRTLPRLFTAHSVTIDVHISE